MSDKTRISKKSICIPAEQDSPQFNWKWPGVQAQLLGLHVQQGKSCTQFSFQQAPASSTSPGSGLHHFSASHQTSGIWAHIAWCPSPSVNSLDHQVTHAVILLSKESSKGMLPSLPQESPELSGPNMWPHIQWPAGLARGFGSTGAHDLHTYVFWFQSGTPSNELSLSKWDCLCSFGNDTITSKLSFPSHVGS